MAKKPSMGRQKIKIAKIEVKNHLQVTFSKRRSGLFKKASELCTLCGVEIAIIVFSPGHKVFSFGHPNVESLIDRFLLRNNTYNNPIANNSLQLVEAHRNASVRGLNLQLTQILVKVEIEKKRGESLDQMRKNSQSQCWWEAPISQLDLQELEQLKDSVEVLKKYVTNNQASKFMVNETANSSTYFGDNGTRTTIETHLKVHGILQNYTFWFHHGERLGEPLSESESKDEHDAEVEECDSEDEVEELLRYLYPNLDGGVTHTNCVEEDPNLVAKQFYKLLSDFEMDDNSFEL
ncbi:hypothetical protein T459_31868 [Capsicum annuum]|uniref:MADS-box domain-containing protein n=1 Tax=Capsicum annuum TaxID=4072 RepID=A0A2G2Y387_CAPAN|nr:hypothetical protein T459_31868 [Capsicum annuum]